MLSFMEAKRHSIRLPWTNRSQWVVVRLVVALLVTGASTYAVTLGSERLMGPEWAGPFFRSAYRVAYFIRLPVAMLASSVWPIEGHHATPSGMNLAVTSFAAPFFWFGIVGLWLIARRAGRKYSHGRAGPQPTSAIPRRVFLTSASACVAGATGLGGYSVLVEPQRLRVARYAISVRDLPPPMDGFRIVQISDTHYGPFVSIGYIRAAIHQANVLEGDLAILTGDYVHRTPLAIGPGVDVLKSVRARVGVVATLGNHDHWEGADHVRAAFAEVGIPLIDNARRFLVRDGFRDGPVLGESICVGGVGDLWEDKADFARAVADAPDEMPRIVLAHNPDTAEHVPPGTRIDLMCSGHTHGGQVWVPGLGTPVTPSAYGQEYAGGLCFGPHCPVLVSRGVGMAVMPVRFGVPPEIVEVTLKRA
ncbi:MAG: metallophosphoesterase [Candidatus Hydrogenedentes bacterium]|nr:metallophosphoesterase [Candidatus Hydrogenedentota bacterium]